MQVSPQKPTAFQDLAVPHDAANLAGLSALVHAFNVQVPVRKPACISEHHIKGHIKQDRDWQIYSKRYQLDSTVEAHLNFAMRYEDVDLLVLKRTFLAVPIGAIENYVQSAPTSILTRRAWYLYELLTGKTLNVPDAPTVTAVDLLDPQKYFTKPQGRLSRRHKVRDNLLGTARFCPIVRRTDALTHFVNLNLSKVALSIIGRVSNNVIARAASFLLLADSQATFKIEGESPPRNRIERWGKAVMQAGKNSLAQPELIRLHQILIEDNRFVEAGIRTEGVFLGEHTPDGEPVPEFIGARPEDLNDLVNSLIETNASMSEAAIDPVIQAAATAFGFVYVHPFADGNGRLHRCLIHHALAERHFTPPGMLFPVSSAMLDWIDLYRSTLKAHSAPLMDFIEWTATAKGNLAVTNDTADLYRYFDCTQAAEFLYQCVKRTIEKDLPREIDYIQRRDEAMRDVMDFVEMPDRLAELFVRYVRQNGGNFPNRRRQEFAALTEEELTKLEEIVRQAFDGFEQVT
jgi:hypothetical protein